MKYYYLFCVAFIITADVLAQTIDFVDGPALPIPTSTVSAASNSSDIFLVGGFTPEAQETGTIYKLDGETQSWSVFDEFSIQKRFASAAIIGEELFIMNGQAGGSLNTSLEIYNIINGNGITINNPYPRKAGGIATYDGHIYTFGGEIAPNQYSNTISRFDPFSYEWEEIAIMPVATETKGDIIDGVLYIVGGFNGSVSDQIFVYDIINDQWRDPITMPVSNSANSVTAIGAELYIIGDFANLSYTAKYNTETNEFSILENNMQPRRHCATANLDGTLWVMGGNTESSITSAIDNVQYVDILSSNHEIKLDLNTTVAPNPGSHSIQFSTNVKNIKIVNLAGDIVIEHGEESSQINTSNLSSGIYYISAQSADGLVHTKWIKQ